MPVPAGGGAADLLATAADLEILLDKTLDTTRATLILEVATAVVQEAAGQRIVRVIDDLAEVIVCGWSNYLRLPQGPVVSVTSVSLDGAVLSAGTASGTYRLAGGRLYRSSGWLNTTGEPSIVLVTYTHGLEDSDQRIQLARAATLSLAAACFENPVGVASEKVDDYAVTYEKAAAAMAASPHLRTALRRQYGRRAGLVTI